VFQSRPFSVLLVALISNELVNPWVALNEALFSSMTPPLLPPWI